MKQLKSAIYNIKKRHSPSYAEELYVALQLSKSLPHNEYAVISDLLLPNDGPIRTSQIDHLIISTHGIFCIETKSHKGWIFGSKIRKLFTQVLYKNTYQISPNPVTQNDNHIKTIKALIGESLKAPIINIIVFPSADRFFIDGYENVGSVNDMVLSIFRHGEKVYTYSEASNIIETVCRYNFKKSIDHFEHVERVKEVYAS